MPRAAGAVDELCCACEGLRIALAEGGTLARNSSMRPPLLRTLFKLIDVGSDKLSLQLANLALVVRLQLPNPPDPIHHPPSTPQLPAARRKRSSLFSPHTLRYPICWYTLCHTNKTIKLYLIIKVLMIFFFFGSVCVWVWGSGQIYRCQWYSVLPLKGGGIDACIWYLKWRQ